MLAESTREELIEAVQSADLCAPEQVTDMVLAAAERGGLEAGLAQLEACRKADAVERSECEYEDCDDPEAADKTALQRELLQEQYDHEERLGLHDEY